MSSPTNVNDSNVRESSDATVQIIDVAAWLKKYQAIWRSLLNANTCHRRFVTYAPIFHASGTGCWSRNTARWLKRKAVKVRSINRC
jgi:hypothetical protein